VPSPRGEGQYIVGCAQKIVSDGHTAVVPNEEGISFFIIKQNYDSAYVGLEAGVLPPIAPLSFKRALVVELLVEGFLPHLPVPGHVADLVRVVEDASNQLLEFPWVRHRVKVLVKVEQVSEVSMAAVHRKVV